MCVLSACDSSDAEAEVALQPPNAAAVGAAVSESEALFKQREDISKLRDAITKLTTMRAGYKRSFDIEWHIARYSYFLGKQSEDKKESETAFTNGRDAGEIAARLEPARVEGHFWYAANLGELAKLNPLTVGLKSVDTIRTSMNRVLEIDPRYQNSSAYDALAQVELETRMTGGSAQKAADILEKALATENDNANLRLHLASAYLMLKRDSDARKQLDAILQMKPHPDYVIEYRASVAEAKKMLARLS
ncbi:MAG TPA: tetratricopeptide repeat protein [Pyrinomonadaceae bacterium]|nr:tetratricopeptide repeat protein [Pyrinomonadaceae bacterium]